MEKLKRLPRGDGTRKTLDADDVIRRWNRGESAIAIAEALECSVAGVYAILKRAQAENDKGN